MGAHLSLTPGQAGECTSAFSFPSHSSSLPLGGNPMCIPSQGCSTLCSDPQIPHEAPALPSGTWTFKHEVEKTCLSLLLAALQGSGSSEYGPVGSGICLWGSPQPLKTKLRSPLHIQPGISSLFFFSKEHRICFSRCFDPVLFICPHV